jgi:hypothetical protein
MDVCVRLFCGCVTLCAGSGLATGCSPVQGLLPTVCRIKKLKNQLRSNKGLWSHRLINIQIEKQIDLLNKYPFYNTNILVLACFTKPWTISSDDQDSPREGIFLFALQTFSNPSALKRPRPLAYCFS